MNHIIMKVHIVLTALPKFPVTKIVKEENGELDKGYGEEVGQLQGEYKLSRIQTRPSDEELPCITYVSCPG